MPSFEPPATFRTLVEKGQLDYWGAPYASLTREQRTALIPQRRHKVLWFQGIEWDRETPAQLPLMRPGLIAFAGNGYGDQYCWYPPWQGQASEPPVLFCPHDQQKATFFAPDCAGLLERLWLQQPSFHDDGEDDELDDDLAAWLTIIEPYLEAPRAAAMRALLDARARPAAFEKVEKEWLSSWPGHDRKLLGPWLMSTRYDDSLFAGPEGADSLRLYDKSIAYFEELVAEGHAQFEEQLATTRENRATAAALSSARHR